MARGSAPCGSWRARGELGHHPAVAHIFRLAPRPPQASTPAAKTPTAAQTSPAVTLAAACESAQFLPSTPSAAPSVVADILESPIVELSSPAVLLAQALPPSPATVEVTLSPALSPLPAAAVHALPFVPRSLAARSAAKAVAASSPSNLSMNALRRQYKDALIVSAGRWCMDDEGVKSAHSAGSSTTSCVDADSEVVESAPAAAPRVKVQLASVVVAKPSYSAVAKLKAAPVAPCESKGTHDLKGMPAGSGVHVHFDEGEGEVQSRGGIKGALACGVHTRFE